MRPLRYSINVTLDGCCDHMAGTANTDIHRIAEANIAKADAIILGRVTYELMEGAWKLPPSGVWPEWMAEWMHPFAHTMDSAKKYLVSDSRDSVDWNTTLVRRDDLESTVRALKAQPGNGLAVGGMTMPLALANLGLIDEYEFVVQPRLAGHGPYLFAGLTKYVDLTLVNRREFASGVVAYSYVPKS